LRSFNLDLMLNLFDQLDARICLRAGEILRKTDANCIQKLREEVSGPVARKRMQAARAAAALGMQHDVAAELVAMARDEDALIRRTAAEVLAEVGTPEAEEVLHEMLGDVNSRVRDEAEKSLAARLAGIVKESQNLSSAVHDSARNEPPVGAES
jgi:HEAT repeat protein